MREPRWKTHHIKTKDFQSIFNAFPTLTSHHQQYNLNMIVDNHKLYINHYIQSIWLVEFYTVNGFVFRLHFSSLLVFKHEVENENNNNNQKKKKKTTEKIWIVFLWSYAYYHWKTTSPIASHVLFLSWFLRQTTALHGNSFFFCLLFITNCICLTLFYWRINCVFYFCQFFFYSETEIYLYTKWYVIFGWVVFRS